MKEPAPFLTTPVAILIGCVMISVAILISGGIIKVGSKATQQAAIQPVASAQPTPKPITLDEVKSAFSKSLLKFGEANKKLVIIEVADPSCPYCSIAAGKNPELNKQAGGQFTLVSEGGNYVPPVPEIAKLVNEGKAAYAYLYTPGHGNGEMGTKALYCANEQGKFWPVHDLLMTSKGYDVINNSVKNDKTKSGELAAFFQTTINPTFMKQCLDSGKYDSRLKEDIALAQSLRITGTPGFYVNNTLFSGAYSFTDMESVVKAALSN